MRLPQITDTNVERHGYTVELLTANKARVSGGRLPKPIMVKKLLGDGDANPKTAKNKVPTRGLSLFPHKGIGFGNVCAFADTCINPCLAHQGQGPVPSVLSSRVAKTVLYYLARDWFMAKLDRELTRFRDDYRGTVGVRLNMFSDISWEDHGVIDRHPDITYYDYSKNPKRWGHVRPNYWVTFSYDGKNAKAARKVLAGNGNVSAVFYNEDGMCGKAAHRQTIPDEFLGAEVIDGGLTDWRPKDPHKVIVGLRLLARTYKSRNSAISSGFATKC